MSRLFSLTAAAIFAATAASQNSIWVPSGAAAAPGNSSTAYPWNRDASPMRYQQLYSAQNFTLQAVTSPVLISRLRFRAAQYQAHVTWSGGSWSHVVLDMSTAAVPYASPAIVYAHNHGPDLQNVFTGPVTVLPGVGAGNGAPGQVHIDIALTTPFLYDPSAGDLCLEVLMDGAGWTGAAVLCDAALQNAVIPFPVLSKRIFNTSSHTVVTGATDTWDYGLVTEFTYVPAAGRAHASPYGRGCHDQARASFYQLFQGGTFNLSNTSIQLIPQPAGYLVVPGGNQWWTPVSQNLLLGAETVSQPLALGFTLNYPGGSTSTVTVSSNGFVWLQPNPAHGCCGGTAAALLSMGPRICPLWTDLNPAAGGTVVFDVDTHSGTAFVTFTNVPEQGTANTNTFQVAFMPNGWIEMRWRNCSVQNRDALTGWSPGGGQRDPGNVNLLTAMPIFTAPDSTALGLAASARPVLGGGINLVTSNIPIGTPVGAIIFSNTQHNPGLDLRSLGMPGCRQYVGLDANIVFVVSGASTSLPLTMPGSPVMAGTRVQCQSATFSPGFNPLGVITSQGLTLVLDLQ